jgi:hypothetical protein
MIWQVDYTLHFELACAVKEQRALFSSNIKQLKSSLLPVTTGDREPYDAWGLKKY